MMWHSKKASFFFTSSGVNLSDYELRKLSTYSAAYLLSLFLPPLFLVSQGPFTCLTVDSFSFFLSLILSIIRNNSASLQVTH